MQALSRLFNMCSCCKPAPAENAPALRAKAPQVAIPGAKDTVETKPAAKPALEVILAPKGLETMTRPAAPQALRDLSKPLTAEQRAQCIKDIKAQPVAPDSVPAALR